MNVGNVLKYEVSNSGFGRGLTYFCQLIAGVATLRLDGTSLPLMRIVK